MLSLVFAYKPNECLPPTRPCTLLSLPPFFEHLIRYHRVFQNCMGPETGRQVEKSSEGLIDVTWIPLMPSSSKGSEVET